VDVEACSVTDGESLDERFEMDAFWRRCLLEGSDEIELALRSEADIRAYEARRPTWMPVLVEGLAEVA
jgi:3-isopropylmalate/(R)-2-methylmalate dehydratase small subunit